MDKRQHGFTIIELIIVVVILGLLAASALPRFTDVTADAEDSAIEGVAGGPCVGRRRITAVVALGSRCRRQVGRQRVHEISQLLLVGAALTIQLQQLRRRHRGGAEVGDQVEGARQ